MGEEGEREEADTSCPTKLPLKTFRGKEENCNPEGVVSLWREYAVQSKWN